MTTSTSHPMPFLSNPALSRDLLAGAVTGQIAGLIMAAVMVLAFTLFLGTSPTFPVQVIGSLVYGERGLVGFHGPAFVAGLALHQLGPSLFWGLAFAATVHRFKFKSRNDLIGLGLSFGVLSQFVDVGIVVPALMQRLHGHDLWAQNVPSFWSWAAHIVFGLALASFAMIRSRMFQRD